MLTSLRISSSVSSFPLACFRCYIAYRVSFIFCLNAFLASVWIRLFALLTAGKRKRTGMYAEIFVSRILQVFAINFLFVIFLENCFFFTHDIYSLPRPTPIPSTHDPRQRITPTPDQPSRASPDQTQSSHSRSTQSNKSRSTQSGKS